MTRCLSLMRRKDCRIYSTRNMGQSPTWGRPGCALACLGQFLARVKIWGVSNPTGRKVVSRKIPLGCVNMRAYNFFDCGPKFTHFFFAQRGKGCSWSNIFPIFDMWICSGDIRDQTRKLSEIALNFRRFSLTNFSGRVYPKSRTLLNTLPRGTSRGKVSWRYSH